MTSFLVTKDLGQLHIGIYTENTPTYQLGEKINAYNNFLTRFFARILGLSMDIKIAGKMRSVNKKSFQNHLQSIGLDQNLLVSNYSKLFKNAPTLENRKLLSESLSGKKTDRLFRVMIKAIQKDEVDIVKELVRKGAPIDRPFFISEANGNIFFDESSMRNFLLSHLPVKPYFYRYTPLSYAADTNNNSAITSFLLTLKPKSSLLDTKIKFSVYEEKPQLS